MLDRDVLSQSFENKSVCIEGISKSTDFRKTKTTMSVSLRQRRIMTTVARKFWEYMKDSDQLVETRTELRNLYNNYFLPVLTDYLERSVPFRDVFWTFRTRMGVVENKPVHDREDIVYRFGRETRKVKSQERRREDVGGFAELKKKLVDRRYVIFLQVYIIIMYMNE